MLKVVNYEKLTQNIVTAIQSGDEAKIKEAFTAFSNELTEKAKQDAADYNNGVANAAIMAQRGYRQLTSDEVKFYEHLIEAGKSDNPRQAWTDLISADGMPETIFEDVYRELKQNYPLLSKIDFQDVKYLTKWLITMIWSIRKRFRVQIMSIPYRRLLNFIVRLL